MLKSFPKVTVQSLLRYQRIRRLRKPSLSIALPKLLAIVSTNAAEDWMSQSVRSRPHLECFKTLLDLYIDTNLQYLHPRVKVEAVSILPILAHA
jgi:hypothetical protein